MLTNTIAVRLSINIVQKTVLSSLAFINNSKETVHINKINGCLNGLIENNVFTIEAEGSPIDYTGVLAKRLRPGPEDVVALDPGGKIDTIVDLSKSYAFMPGNHAYIAYYSAFHQFPDRPGYVSLKSNTISFTYKGE